MWVVSWRCGRLGVAPSVWAGCALLVLLLFELANCTYPPWPALACLTNPAQAHLLPAG